MNKREFAKWLKQQGSFNALQELYAIVLEGNHGIDAVKAWIDGKDKYDDPDLGEVVFLMATPHPVISNSSPTSQAK